ncbi:MAG: universal stress protein [Melioribacteraceae bacterium]|nr:universal stress protein [Melioribacteraceae bacterium]MCF8354928.1 universal stress protein [Melioribacteraceae bacterium]MCF8392383.1 universal stress protein [Melioribacteraceae bacterium]MCF8417904.1 universal stress protein [Melioribacteraceae bacterium]
MPYKRLGLAITFSPTGKNLLIEAARLKKLFNAELILLHVGEKSEESEDRLKNLIDDCSISGVEITWAKGDPAKAILNFEKKKSIDLMIAGALEKEKPIKYYIGSVARKIMRSSNCSVLIIPARSGSFGYYKRFFVTTDFSQRSSETMKKAYEFAKLENAEKFVLIREINIPGLAFSVDDTGSTRNAEMIKKEWEIEEKIKLNIFLSEMNIQNTEAVETVCVYGKSGWAATSFAKENDADIFVVSAPVKTPKFFDRVFTHDFEYTIKQIHSPLLIIKS